MESIKLLRSGDIQKNHGPWSVCRKSAVRTHRLVEYSLCKRKFQISPECGNIPVRKYLQLKETLEPHWICPACKINNQHTNRQPEISQQIHQFHMCSPFSALKGQKNLLKIGNININGLLGKLNEVKLVTQTASFDILAASETCQKSNG